MEVSNKVDSGLPEIRCKCCQRRPEEIPYYVEVAKDEKCTPDQIAKEDGTYNPRTREFYCFTCYIKVGMPLGTA